jgi:hypothetical protein
MVWRPALDEQLGQVMQHVIGAQMTCCGDRLENSRLGRAWMALRDDEDVAQALGINLVRSKLLSYGLGAAFAGLAGSIFASMLTSVYPSSFRLLISVNVVALLIVGGMGSLPGVVIGALALIGLPELLREFGEYRYLFYGAVLIVMMRLRPEGLWPSDVRRRELRANDESLALDDAGGSLAPVSDGTDREMSDEPLLRCRGVPMRFGGLVALSNLDIAVAPRTIHSVIGPNGAGS